MTAKRINRADLLRALQDNSDVLLPVAAELCGFKAPPKRTLQVKLPAVSNDGGQVQPDKPSVPDPLPKSTGKSQAQFYRVIDRKPSEVLPEPVDGKRLLPATFEGVTPLNPDAVEALKITPPEKEPLVAWAKLWPVLRRLLSEYTQTRQPDIPKLVRTVANGEWLSRIPRKQRQRWTANVQVLVDRPERTCLFNQDYNRLLADLRTLRGETGLSVLRLLHQPGGRVRLESGKQRATRDWQPPGAGTTVFILSDLGLLDESGFARRAWLKVGRQLRTAGCQPLVLLPLPQRYLTPELVKVFDCVGWDRRSHLQPIHYVVPSDHKQPSVFEQDSQKAEELLAWLSPAVRIEPALLRALRHQLAAAGVDVGLEAAAWHHEDVVRSSIGIHFKPEKQVIKKYRERLKCLQAQAENRALAIRVAALILRYHRHVFPTQLYEELLILAAMLGDDVPAAKREIAEAEQHMRELVKAGLGEQSAALPGIRPYLFHLEERQHHAVKQEYDFYQAVYGAKRVEQGKALAVPDGFAMKNVLAFVDPNTQVQRDYVLFQEGQQALQLATEQRFREGDGSGFSTGSALANFTTTSGLMTRQLRKADGTLDQQILPLDDNETLTFPLEQDEVQQLDVAGQAITLERFQKPKWADKISFSHQDNISVVSGGVTYYWHEPEIDTDSDEVLRGFWFYEPDNTNIDQYGAYTDVDIAGISHRFRWIEPTAFHMGSPETEEGRYDDETQHEVILTQGYWLAETTCTQALWDAVMGNSFSDFNGDNLPVDRVSWRNVQAFIKKANQQYPDLQLRLPTEAEWENACRAGTTGAFNVGEKNDLNLEQVNYRGIWDDYDKWGEGALKQTAPVESYSPNQWGLYQMHGNLLEWCQDLYEQYPSGQVRDPQGAQSGSKRLLRGGSWIKFGRRCRSAYRDADNPSDRYRHCSFRLARGHASPVRSGAGQQPIGSRATGGRRGGQAGDGQQNSGLAQKQTTAQTNKQPKDSIWKSVLRGVSGRKKK